MSRPRIPIRDAIKYILSHLDSYYERTPTAALTLAFSRVRRMTPDELSRLRRRRFGRLPTTQTAAIQFLRSKFRDHRETLELLEEEDIESVSTTQSTATTMTAESESTSTEETESTATTLSYSTDSEATIPIV